MWHKKPTGGGKGFLPSGREQSDHQMVAKVNHGNGVAGMANGLPPKPKSSASDNGDFKSRFGYFKWRPNWMQVFNNPKFLLVILCAITFTQAFGVTGISSVNVTTFERRFGLSSTRVGWIASSYDICAGITVMPVSYLALRVNKHRLMAVSSALLALGGFVMWLPHILAEKYEWGTNVGVCSADSDCPQDGESVSPYFYVLIMGQVLKSLGGTAIYSVGVSSLDDCVSSLKAPLYLGIMYAFSAIGPAAGYVLGGYFLDFYVDFETDKTIEITPEDPRWVGAWWLGYIIVMALGILLVFPFFGLPRDLPAAKAVKEAKMAEAEVVQNKSNVGTSLKDLPRVTWMLLTNKVFVLTTLAAASESMVIVGSSTFFPKFIENQFGQTPGFSAILTGVLAVPGAAGGFILGGYLCRRFKLTMRGALRLCFACTFLSMLFGTALWMHCDGKKTFAGVNVAYNDSSFKLDTPSLVSGCNAGCSCDQENYAPVCDAKGVQYFSACYAGCKQLDGTNYKSCSCVNAGPGGNQTVTKGACEVTCDWLYAFLMLFFGMMITTFINATPITVVTLRCVPVTHKTFALGVQWMLGRFLGFVPGPLLYGVIVDSACLVWKKSCGTDTELSCWIYSTFSMRRNIFLLSAGIKLLSAILYILASFACKAAIRVEPDYTLTVEPPGANVAVSIADLRASVDTQRDKKTTVSTIS